MPIRTYNFSKGTSPLGRVKLVYAGTLECICNYQFADFFFEFFFDKPFNFLGSTARRPFDRNPNPIPAAVIMLTRGAILDGSFKFWEYLQQKSMK